MSLARLAERLAVGELSPSEAVQWYLDRIEALNGVANAYITVRAEEALADAKSLERTDARGPLWGVPIAVSDVIDVAGVRTTGASKVCLNSGPAVRDATVVERLRASGAVILGKLNSHEFAFGAMTSSEYFGATRNPWAHDRTSGGSGGAGAAATWDLAAGTVATDTGGSIRVSAANCGVTGLRPTSGRVSNHGVIPVSWTFDTVGPIARSAEDCALLLDAIAGRDIADASTLPVPVPRYQKELTRTFGSVRIGLIAALFETSDEPIVSAVMDAVDEFKSLGARVEWVDIGMLSQTPTIQQAILLPELAAAHHSWLRERLSDYTEDFRVRPLAGLFIPAVVYLAGQRGRSLAHAELKRIFDRFDLLVSPTVPVPPPQIGSVSVERGGQSASYASTLIPFNSPWSVSGAPAINVPCGFVSDMPAGMLIGARGYNEAMLLRAAYAYQSVTDWHERRPPQTS